MGLLARIFPVLRRVPNIATGPAEAIIDQHVVRVRAFIALRELLAGLARKGPLVVSIDDVHWGDVDSASLLLELVRPPAAPPLLLIMTHRDGDALSSPFLIEANAHWPEKAELRDLAVGPLDAGGAERLALALLGSDDEDSRRRAATIAQESGGSPFLVEELARSMSGLQQARSRRASPRVAPRDTRSNRWWARGWRASPARPARYSRSSPLEVDRCRPRSWGDACGTGDATYELIALLSARRFVHIGLRDGDDVVETRHDRIRETIVAQLPDHVVRDYHGRLARVLETTPGTDPEAMTVHLLGAGETGARDEVRRACGRAGHREARLRPRRAPLPTDSREPGPVVARRAPAPCAPGQRARVGRPGS